MILSNKVLLKGMQRTLDDVFMPSLSKPNDLFVCRIASALCEFMANRDDHEGEVVAASNEDMRTTVSEVLEQVGEGSEAEKILEPVGGSLESLEDATPEDANVQLKGALVNAWNLMPEMAEDTAAVVKDKVAACSERCVFRDYELIKSLEEFQKSLYDMG